MGYGFFLIGVLRARGAPSNSESLLDATVNGLLLFFMEKLRVPPSADPSDSSVYLCGDLDHGDANTYFRIESINIKMAKE